MHSLVRKKTRSLGPLASKIPVFDRFSDIFSETSVYVQIFDLFYRVLNSLLHFSKLISFSKLV